MKTLLRPLKRLLVRLIVWLIPRLLRIPGVMQAAHFTQWEAQRFHITPVHFYQPIPDTRELAIRYPERSALIGIAWQPEAQLALLKQFSAYAEATRAFRKTAPPENSDEFYLENGHYMGVDPHIYYCMIRHFQPRLIIEVGAGFSTLVAVQAAQHTRTQLIALEPYPREFIARGAHGIQHVGKKAEDAGFSFFAQLQAGDFLFIDSSHVVKTGGDVTYLVLEVLPRLAAGVIVHVHDIFLPEDYPRNWLLERHWFWTEQYLIHALLIHNPKIEVLLGTHWLTVDHPDALKALFPEALRYTGGSLWLRTR